MNKVSIITRVGETSFEIRGDVNSALHTYQKILDIDLDRDVKLLQDKLWIANKKISDLTADKVGKSLLEKAKLMKESGELDDE